MNDPHLDASSDKPVLLALAAIGIIYACLTVMGVTRHTAFVGDGHEVEEAASAADHGAEVRAKDEHAEDTPTTAHGSTPPFWAVSPFVMLLGAIAVFPLLNLTEHWWESNLHRFYVAAGLAIATLIYYQVTGGLTKTGHVLDHAILEEYIPFIVLLFSLYTISGGIRIEGDMVASPLTNAIFIAVGGLLASFIGTTGAAMLLIRPLLETNTERKHVQHTVVFFIFVVCNCGGCLLPIGDPPLFLGYLKGVEFMWTMYSLWLPWLFVNAVLIAIYLCLDSYYYHPRETVRDIRRDETQVRPLKVTGLRPNAPLLLGVIFAVAFLDPSKPFPGTDWNPWLYLREIVQLAMVAFSLWLGTAEIRVKNRFNYHAIVEVAALFIGIFICMQPAIEILHEKGSQLGLTTAPQLFWATGILSSVLDNAPTYVVFFETAAAGESFVGRDFAVLVSETSPLAASANELLSAISLGAVFMGAMTYIGNGPNFMVRAIAEQTGVRMPSFFGYVLRYSLPFMVPVMVLTVWLFLR